MLEFFVCSFPYCFKISKYCIRLYCYCMCDMYRNSNKSKETQGFLLSSDLAPPPLHRQAVLATQRKKDSEVVRKSRCDSSRVEWEARAKQDDRNKHLSIYTNFNGKGPINSQDVNKLIE
jgi:hypothetical protein